MEQNTRFPKNELVKYEHIPTVVSGESYLLVMPFLNPNGEKNPQDFALRAKISRDGLEAFRFTEKDLRKKKSDRDLYWTVTDEGDGTVSLWSKTARKYLNLTEQGATLSRKKQRLSLRQNGTLLQLTVSDKTGETMYLRYAPRKEGVSGAVFTSGKNKADTSFGLFKRVCGIPAVIDEKPLLTVGTYSDLHVDYALQTKPPYVRPTMPKAARGYRRRYDLDAVIVCGDTISDNGSGSRSNPGKGAMQGYWGYDRWQKTRRVIYDVIRKSFRSEAKSKNIFFVTGNHEYQIGDRQPDGKRYNSAYMTDLLPQDLLHPLTEHYTTYRGEEADLGPDENLICYEYRINGIPFLILNNPQYDEIPWPWPDRGEPAHTMRQAEWLEQRLNEIEKERGRDAVVIVASHYPFYPDCFVATYNGPTVKPNMDAYLKMSEVMSRFPNLFYFFGHVHGNNDITFSETAEVVSHVVPVDLKLDGNGTGWRNAVSPEEFARKMFRSDAVLPAGFHHVYCGSHSYFNTKYFESDGKKVNTTLSAAECPFPQGCVLEVYSDRVVLTMQQFGTKNNTAQRLPGSSYRVKPLVCPIVKQ